MSDGETRGSGMYRREQMRERFAAYQKLRDAGVLPVDAGREVGVADGTRQTYERAYRDARGLPRRPSGGWV